MTGADDIRAAIAGAQVLAFPQKGAASAVRSQTGGGADPPRQEMGAGDDGGGERRRGAGDGIDLACARLPLTDLGNAERLATRFRERLRYCPELGWLFWDGRRWRRDGADEEVKRAEHATARAIQDEAKAVAETPEADFETVNSRGKKCWYSDLLRAWGRSTEGVQRLAAMSKRAAAMLAIAIEALDRDPMKINALNGTLHVSRDIADGYIALRPHDPGDYITRLAPVTYDPAADCPLFDRFLEETHPPEAAVGGDAPRRGQQTFLMTWFGYSLTGDTGEQKMVFLYGKGRNGKGVLVNAVAHVAGSYADSIPIESFIDGGRARAGGQATPDIAGLPGVRLLSTSEPRKGATLDDAFVKLFTGGDTIKARHLNKDYFAFRPQAKLTMQGNYRPKTGADEGIASRVVLVPCHVFIPPDKRDAKLGEKLKAEASGILNRMLDGLRTWLEHGLVLPDAVAAATAQYRADNDPLGRFLETCTAQDALGRVQASKLYEVFCAWAKANGESVWANKGFGSALKERGLTSLKSDTLFWVGIRLTKSVFDFGTAAAAEDGGGEPMDD